MTMVIGQSYGAVIMTKSGSHDERRAVHRWPPTFGPSQPADWDALLMITDAAEICRQWVFWLLLTVAAGKDTGKER